MQVVCLSLSGATFSGAGHVGERCGGAWRRHVEGTPWMKAAQIENKSNGRVIRLGAIVRDAIQLLYCTSGALPVFVQA